MQMAMLTKLPTKLPAMLPKLLATTTAQGQKSQKATTTIILHAQPRQAMVMFVKYLAMFTKLAMVTKWQAMVMFVKYLAMFTK
jgi:hypothetical protein